MQMRLRPAGMSDLDLLRAWDEKPHVIRAVGTDGALDWDNELPRRLSWRELLIAEVQGRAIGVLQIIDPAEEETRYWGAIEPNLRAIDIWIGEEADLGRGHGTAMMHLALERCFAEAAVTAVVVDPLADNRCAHRFYRRLGFAAVERRRFDDENCLVHRLERSRWRQSIDHRSSLSDR
ncbi:MAG: GNAT family N-acetyltransferase [Alphaproteobacteria bacterium]